MFLDADKPRISKANVHAYHNIGTRQFVTLLSFLKQKPDSVKRNSGLDIWWTTSLDSFDSPSKQVILFFIMAPTLVSFMTAFMNI